MAKKQATALSEFGKRRFRWRERLLLLLPFCFLLLEMFQLPISLAYRANIDIVKQQPLADLLPNVQDLVPILGFIGVMVVVHIVLTIFFPKADQMLFPVVVLLSGLGVLMALRTGPDASTGSEPDLGTKQLLWVSLGLVVFLITLF